VEVAVQINGKFRGTVVVRNGASEEEVREAVMSSGNFLSTCPRKAVTRSVSTFRTK